MWFVVIYLKSENILDFNGRTNIMSVQKRSLTIKQYIHLINLYKVLLFQQEYTFMKQLTLRQKTRSSKF